MFTRCLAEKSDTSALPVTLERWKNQDDTKTAPAKGSKYDNSRNCSRVLERGERRNSLASRTRQADKRQPTAKNISFRTRSAASVRIPTAAHRPKTPRHDRIANHAHNTGSIANRWTS